MKRKTLERRLSRFGLELSSASAMTRMEAAGRYESRLPRWEVSDCRHRSSVKDFSTLIEVEAYLDELAIARGV